jgi:hypothetical protein
VLFRTRAPTTAQAPSPGHLRVAVTGSATRIDVAATDRKGQIALVN